MANKHKLLSADEKALNSGLLSLHGSHYDYINCTYAPLPKTYSFSLSTSSGNIAVMSTDIMSVKATRRKTKVKESRTTLSDLIIKIVSASEERAGVSLVAMKKALAANGYDAARNNSRINLAVKRMVVTGKLTQTKGTGASGSFKIGTKTETKRKKPKAKKATRKKAKKRAGAKKKPKKSRRMSLKSPGEANETAAEPAVKIKRSKRIKRRVSKTSKAKDAKK